MSARLRECVDGILLLDKPVGRSSNAVLQKAKYLFNAQKAGHTGSLDPLASGMLPICFGEATKFSRFLLDERKTYQTVMRLGITTTTGDEEGEVLAQKAVPELTPEKLQEMLSRFQGEQRQIPPMYSAVKIQGQPLYKLARQGKEVERHARTIIIYRLKLDNIYPQQMIFRVGAKPSSNRSVYKIHEDCERGAGNTPENSAAKDSEGVFVTLTIECSKGTYIRTLVEDMGAYLGCGAHVAKLRRLSVWPFEGSSMLTFQDLEDTLPLYRKNHLLDTGAVLSLLLPKITLDESATFNIYRGQVIQSDAQVVAGWVILTDSQGAFLGVGEIFEDGRVAPRRLMQQKVTGMCGELA